MKKVWKYPLPPPEDYFELEAPVGVQWLHVGVVNGQRCLWALVNPEAKKRRFGFRWAGTGHPIHDPIFQHVGTFFEEPLVWHIFQCELR